MKRRLATLVLLAGFVPVAAAMATPGTPATGVGSALSPATSGANAGRSTGNDQSLTLPDALARALATSPRLEEARSQVARAQGQKRGARAEGMPDLSVSASQAYQGPTKSIKVPGGGGSQSVTSSHPFEASADVTVPLDTNGRIRAGKRGANQAEKAAKARLEAEAQRLVLDVTESYLDLQQAQQQVVLDAELRRLNAERLRVAKVRLAAGVGVPLEVSQPEADLAQAVQQEIEARARLRQVGATLNSLIGRPANAELRIAELGARNGIGTAQSGILSSQTAIANRPDLRALRAEGAQAQAGIDSARAARRPALALSGSVIERVPETLLGGWAWSLGASLVQSLFDGGRARARIEQARADRMRAKAVLAQAERDADAQIEQAQAGLEAAEKRQTAEDQRVIAATDAMAVARKRFK